MVEFVGEIGIEAIEYYLESSRIEECLQVFNIINNWFHVKKLTKIDNIKSYDYSNVEVENIARGL